MYCISQSATTAWLYVYCLKYTADTYTENVQTTPLLAPGISLYTAFVVSLKDALIGWRAPDCDAPIQLLRIQISTGNTVPSPTWRKQKAFPFPGTVALWVFCKSREFLAFFRGRGQSYARRHGTWKSLRPRRKWLFTIQSCRVRPDISRSPIDFQWGSRKYPGQHWQVWDYYPEFTTYTGR